MTEQEIRNKRVYGSVMITFFAILAILLCLLNIISLGILTLFLGVYLSIGLFWFQVFKMRK